MNKLAEELNSILSNTIISSLLSELGKNLYFPKGLVAQTEEANEHAHNMNATVGMAFHNNEVMYLPVIKNYIPEIKAEEIFPYSSPAGDILLRKLWQKEILKKNPDIKNDISLPIVTSGITHGLFTISELFADKGDTIILPDLNWGNYKLIFETKKQCNFKCFPFFSNNSGFNINGFKNILAQHEKLEKLIIILNFPNNPTGYSPTENEVKAIVQTLKERANTGQNILVITDDSYFGLFYENDIYNQSIFSRIYNAHKNILAVKLDGATKEYFAWGFRIGFITISSKGLNHAHYNAFEKKVLGSIRSTISNCNKAAQTLLTKAMQSKTYIEEKQKAGKILKDKYLKVREILSSTKIPDTLTVLPFNSGYFMCFKLNNGKSSEELRKKLLFEKGIGTISIEDKYLRIAFSKIDINDLEALYAIIFNTAEEL